MVGEELKVEANSWKTKPGVRLAMSVSPVAPRS